MTNKNQEGRIVRISGPVIEADGMRGSKMYDVVRVGEENLIGEIIRLNEDNAIIQVYEDTVGLKPGEKVISTDMPLSVDLGPGLLTNIYDGIQRPLPAIFSKTGDFISRGVEAPAMDRKKKWHFKPTVKAGDKVRIKDRKDWPSPPGYLFANAEGTVVNWIDWEEPMEEFQDYAYVSIEKAGTGAEEFIGKCEFFRVTSLEKI